MAKKLTIDGKEITARDDATIIQAAHEAGIVIPHYCYHPKLSIAGNCRMCLVELEGRPKLEISCNTPVADNMVVFSNSPRVVEGRRGVEGCQRQAGGAADLDQDHDAQHQDGGDGEALQEQHQPGGQPDVAADAIDGKDQGRRTADQPLMGQMQAAIRQVSIRLRRHCLRQGQMGRNFFSPSILKTRSRRETRFM